MAQLLNEQRHAATVVVDLRGGKWMHAWQQSADGITTFSLLKGLQRYRSGPVRPARGLVDAVAVGDQHQQGLGQRLQLPEHRLAGVVGPLPIVQHQHQRELCQRLGRQALEQTQ